jgi:hypothetical protein
MTTGDSTDEPMEQLLIQLPHSTISKIDAFRREWGLRSRSNTVERILDELFKAEPCS